MIFAEAPLKRIAPHIEPETLSDCEVVGLSGDGQVLCFRADDKKVYSTGLYIEDFINTSKGWTMTWSEACRVGVLNYNDYLMNRRQASESTHRNANDFVASDIEPEAPTMAM